MDAASESLEASGLPDRDRVTSAVRVEWWIVSAWALPVLLTVLGQGPELVRIATTIAATISWVAILTSPATVLTALPFFALLSPAAGFFELSVGRLLLSDALFILLGIQLLLLTIGDRVRLLRTIPGQLGALVAVLYLVSVIAGILTGTLVSLKPILYVVQLTIIALYTNTFATARPAQQRVVDAWIVATFLGAVLLIHAFLTGRSLSRFDSAAADTVIDLANISYLFRADYYYTGFHFAVGISIVILAFRMLVGGAGVHRMRGAVGLAVLFAALLMMLNKTAILSVGITVAALFVVFIPQLPARVLRRTTLAAIAAVIVGYFAISTVYLSFIGDAQREIWGLSAVGTGSLAVRLSVYASALTAWLTYPLQVLIGMGPDFLEGSGNAQLALAFKTAAETRQAEGTVDSGWISYLTELGIVSFLALVAWVGLGIRSGYQRLKLSGNGEAEALAVAVVAGLLFTSIALTTQMLGYTKVTWFPFQLLLIGFLQARTASFDSARTPTTE